MTIFNQSALTVASIVNSVQQRLLAHRAALDALNELYSWSSGVALADLQAIGFSAADAGTLIAAIADAHAEYLLHTTGLPPGTYPQPASAYVYAASQTQVIGPQ